MRKWLLTPPSFDDILILLQAWRFWLAGALIGGLLGASVYWIFPPAYRAAATVVVDFNLEQSWPDNPDSQLFYYLDRESRKLAELARSDATLAEVANNTGFSVLELRTQKLELSQPQDGGWHFYATDPNPEVAAKLAAAWAEAFSKRVREAIQVEINLDATRKALVLHPGDPQLLTAIASLEAKAPGITPELQISLAQDKDLPAMRKTGIGSYALAGAAILLALACCWILFLPAGRKPATS
jgi:hypothetical protein